MIKLYNEWFFIEGDTVVCTRNGLKDPVFRVIGEPLKANSTNEAMGLIERSLAIK